MADEENQLVNKFIETPTEEVYVIGLRDIQKTEEQQDPIELNKLQHDQDTPTSTPDRARPISTSGNQIAFDNTTSLESHLKVEVKWIPIAASLTVFSIIGTLIRIGLVKLHTFEGAPVFPILYPQVNL